MKIAYFGFDFFSACLEKLIGNGHDVCLIFTAAMDGQYDTNERVLDLARDNCIEVRHDPVSGEDMKDLHERGVELIVSAAYPYKIPDWQTCSRWALNIHPTLLPEGRGPWPLPRIILDGYQESGISFHEISSKFDCGPVIFQSHFALDCNETLESLSAKSQMVAFDSILYVIDNIDRLWPLRIEQRGGSYWCMPSEYDRTIDFSMTIDRAKRQVRAFSKFETFVSIEGVKYFVRDIDAWKADHNYEIGKIVLKGGREILISAADGFILLKSFERAWW